MTFRAFSHLCNDVPGGSFICILALGTLALSEEATRALVCTREAVHNVSNGEGYLGIDNMALGQFILRPTSQRERKKYCPNLLEGDVADGDGRQRWKWGGIKGHRLSLDRLELVRVVRLDLLVGFRPCLIGCSGCDPGERSSSY